MENLLSEGHQLNYFCGGLFITSIFVVEELAKLGDIGSSVEQSIIVCDVWQDKCTFRFEELLISHKIYHSSISAIEHWGIKSGLESRWSLERKYLSIVMNKSF